MNKAMFLTPLYEEVRSEIFENDQHAKTAAHKDPLAMLPAVTVSRMIPGETLRSINGHRFAMNEPIHIPLQTRLPKINKAAKATPDGGQTAVTTPSAIAINRPSLAIRT